MGSETLITDAVILMAGSGSRLRASGELLPKPLVPICGRPLICYIIDALEKVGVRNLHTVVGVNGNGFIPALRELVPSSMRLNPIANPESHKQNGISLLCAAGEVRAPFALTMGDHLFDSSILQRLVDQPEHDELNLAVDRKIESIFDLDDAMKVRTEGGRVTAIGKDLDTYDAIDTGAFVCSAAIFDALREARQKGDCSLADGVRLLAREEKVRAIDIGADWWQDVDTLAMRARAEEVLGQKAAATR